MQEIKEDCYNRIIYCYVEEQSDILDKFISKYNDESIIYIVPSVVESCESKLLYCLSDIITNYIEADKNTNSGFLFITDVKNLYNIVKRFYFSLFEKIIYIDQKTKKKFNDELETEEFINYFLNIQRSILHASFMRKLWNLKICENVYEFTKFLYELDRFDINKDKSLSKYWCCFCEILLYQIENNTLKYINFNYKLSIYSILMVLSKNPDYTNKYLTEILENNKIEAENMYFVWYQLKRMELKNIIILDGKSNLLKDELYEKSYNGFKKELNNSLVKISLEERNKNLVMILTIQFLNETHAPTRTVLERAKVLKKLGKEVVIINTTEQYTEIGYLPMYSTGFGRTLEEYNNINKISIGGDSFIFMQMPGNAPINYRMQLLLKLLKKYKPYYILSIGTGSILADLCGNIVPCASMALAFSTFPKTKNKMKIIGRKLSEKEKKLYIEDDIIESRFTFELKPQKESYSRCSKKLPEDMFVLIVVGIRLEYEVDKEFMDMLANVCKMGCYVVFAGIMNNYGKLMENYPVVCNNSSFIGYCDDILALMEICDLYVNPKRLGGGFSIIEAFSKGVPGVYLKSGDVYTAGGEEFAVDDFHEMARQILRYKEDKDYYNTMAKLAKERACLMTSSREAIEDIDRQICQRIEEKYW